MKLCRAIFNLRNFIVMLNACIKALFFCSCKNKIFVVNLFYK